MIKSIEVAFPLNEAALNTQIKILAESDQDMDVRKAAMKLL